MKALDTRAYSRATCDPSSATYLMKKDKLFLRIILLLAGAFFLGLGVALSIDCIHALISIVISLLFLHGIYGVREGTLVGALLVGYLVTLLERYDPLIDRLLGRE